MTCSFSRPLLLSTLSQRLFSHTPAIFLQPSASRTHDFRVLSSSSRYPWSLPPLSKSPRMWFQTGDVKGLNISLDDFSQNPSDSSCVQSSVSATTPSPSSHMSEFSSESPSRRATNFYFYFDFHSGDLVKTYHSMRFQIKRVSMSTQILEKQALKDWIEKNLKNFLDLLYEAKHYSVGFRLIHLVRDFLGSQNYLNLTLCKFCCELGDLKSIRKELSLLEKDDSKRFDLYSYLMIAPRNHPFPDTLLISQLEKTYMNAVQEFLQFPIKLHPQYFAYVCSHLAVTLLTLKQNQIVDKLLIHFMELFQKYSDENMVCEALCSIKNAFILTLRFRLN
jgi:hypothetical protein